MLNSTRRWPALATNHDSQKKTVSITFDGTGNRQARVAYLTETPVWKTTYRLVLDEDKAPYLQGWAIVENQTSQDWHKGETLSCLGTAYFLHDGSVSTAL